MNGKPTKKQSRTDWKRLQTMREEVIDYSDIPPLGEAFTKHAKLWKPRVKRSVRLRVDSDLMDWFQAQGRTYEERINAALRVYVEAHKH